MANYQLFFVNVFIFFYSLNDEGNCKLRGISSGITNSAQPGICCLAEAISNCQDVSSRIANSDQQGDIIWIWKS